MRGRRPHPVILAPADLACLRQVARCRCLPFAQVQHARILLAAAAGQRVREVAQRHRFDPSTVWRLCRRYEQGGRERLLADLPRSGRPPQLSPPPVRRHR